ncbi:MAG: DUF3883 domain-containing protein, partial [Thermoleophilaceae bacterium]|nr:DUF3883 domain-containing protein [Thermoleophilaceae bacterium]
VREQMLFREHEAELAIEGEGPAWAFDADGQLFRLVSEARRIRLAHLFDPLLAVTTSVVEPLPHQIRAVYGSMLPRQPLRFLLADDPGAGKTIMTGLYMKELLLRGDMRRCLVVAPGNLVEQWQEELFDKFGLELKIVTRDMVEAARTGNPFAEENALIARLDHLSRNEHLQERLRVTEWDFVVVDEAHKMSARYFGDELKRTKRYELGELLGSITRHFLLLTATPHSGDEESFQLFLALLDADRFAGRARDGTRVDASDLMRRMLKEDLLRFDGRPLFPERRAYSVGYELSDEEALLYDEVTAYVKDEMNRADRLAAAGEGRRGNTVGFALTILQRRLASSPEAIYQSLRRRRERLEERLRAARLGRRAEELRRLQEPPLLGDEELEDVDDLPEAELEELEEELVDQATTAETVAELEAEIATLGRLEELARRVRNSRRDRKWEELSKLLHDEAEMFDRDGARRKLIVFTEHRDTLNYLTERLRVLLGRDDAVVTVHGGTKREERKRAQELFTQEKDCVVLVATDAAGEGINLQRAHLVVNYDLPWNPNRIEQRFGRVHRIGQTEVCHMWNLVATETREGDVFARLLTKIEQQRESLGGRVYDVIGQVFEGQELKRLLIEAIRYGERPEVRERLERVVDERVGQGLRELVREHALAADVLGPADVERIKEELERAEARRLQPHYIRAFFLEALERLGGRVAEREPGRYEITHVPAAVRERDRQIGVGAPVLRRYERVTFEKDLVRVPGKPLAVLVAPGHPLLDAVLDVTLERHASLLKHGAVLVDETDPGEEPRLLLYLEHAIEDGRVDRAGNPRVVSRRFQFVELGRDGAVRVLEGAPYLDYRPASDEERELLRPELDAAWLRGDVEQRGLEHAVAELAPRHLEEVRRRTIERVDRTAAAVRERLLREIAYWDHRANELAEQERAGKQPRMNPERARQRAEELQGRLDRRLAELERERRLTSKRPVVVGGALVVPDGLLARLGGRRQAEPAAYARDTERVERLAVDAVLDTERALGREPREMPRNNPGYDIESRAEGRELLFLEVKGRVAGAEIVTVTKNEILTALNKPDRWLLALVEVRDDDSTEVRYLRRPFTGNEETYFDVTSVNFEWKSLW